MTEGACVLCGRRIPWVALWRDSYMGVCRLCFSGWKGEAEARSVEARLGMRDERDAA